MRIEAGNMDEPVRALIALHVATAHAETPAGFAFALPADALTAPGHTLYSAWDADDALMGIAALRELDAEFAELKSMRTANGFLRRGVARALLLHLIGVARDRGYRRLLLETGATEAFAPARALYRAHGFVPRGRYGDYPDSGFTQFFEREL